MLLEQSYWMHSRKFAVGSPVSQVTTAAAEQLTILETVFIFPIMTSFTVKLKKTTQKLH